jgi:Domain of unknown function (DUF397)
VAEVDVNRLEWRKSRMSGTSNCVEVAFAGSTVLLRHSKDPAGPVLALGRDEWTAFLAGVRHGEFDLRPERHQPGV